MSREDVLVEREKEFIFASEANSEINFLTIILVKEDDPWLS